MFDLSWSEILIIAIVLIVVVGPKDLPHVLRSFGRTMSKVRSMAGDFRKQFDDAVREAELDDLKSLAEDARNLHPARQIRNALSPMEDAARGVREGVDRAMKPAAPLSSQKPAATPRPAEPQKVGAAALPEALEKAAPAEAAAAPMPKPAPVKAAQPKRASAGAPGKKTSAAKPAAGATAKATTAKTKAPAAKTPQAAQPAPAMPRKAPARARIKTEADN